MFLARLIPTFFGRPCGVIASDGGLECRTVFGRQFTLAWGEMRLFEVEKKSSARLFYVYGSHDVATWRVAPASSNEFVPAGISGPEMALRLDALNTLIVARTGLSPSTFSRSLASVDQSRLTTGSLMRSLVGSGFVCALALICLATAAAVLLFPPMTAAAHNEVFAIGPAIIGLALLVNFTWVLIQRLAGHRTSAAIPYQPQPVVAPPPSSPDTVFSLQERLGLLPRVAFAVCGVLALPDLIPLVIVLVPPVVGSLAAALHTATPNINSSGGAFFVDYLLGIFGVGGLVGLRIAWRGSLGSTVYANKQGISAGSNRAAVAIPWTAIGRITARREGQSMRYVIYGARTRIQVRDNPRRRHLVSARPGTSAIMPDELAVLASERSGKPIEWGRERLRAHSVSPQHVDTPSPAQIQSW